MSKKERYSTYDQIIDFIKEHPGCTSRDISNGINLGRQTVNKYMREIYFGGLASIKMGFARKGAGKPFYTYTFDNKGGDKRW